jgi:hypothetical protein
MQLETSKEHTAFQNFMKLRSCDTVLTILKTLPLDLVPEIWAIACARDIMQPQIHCITSAPAHNVSATTTLCRTYPQYSSGTHNPEVRPNKVFMINFIMIKHSTDVVELGL